MGKHLLTLYLYFTIEPFAAGLFSSGLSPMMLQRVPVKTIIDSGLSNTVMNNAAASITSTLMSKESKSQAGTGIGGGTGKLKAYPGMVKNISIGDEQTHGQYTLGVVDLPLLERMYAIMTLSSEPHCTTRFVQSVTF